MNQITNKSSSSSNDLLEKRFIGLILREEASELDANQQALMSSRGFTSDALFNNRGFQVVDDHKLVYTHPMIMRFIDMKTRKTKSGKTTRKRAHPIHNKPIYGMINNMLSRLQFEYTDRMKAMLSKEYKIEL